MYERFTDRARKVVWLADEEAQRLGVASVATEHILLGLLKEGQGVAAKVLRGCGVELGVLLRAVEAECPPPPTERQSPPVFPRIPWWRPVAALRRLLYPHRLPIAPDCKRVIEFAMREARSLGHNYVGTEHLLLGLLHQPDTEAARLLTVQGLKLDAVRRETLALLGAAS